MLEEESETLDKMPPRFLFLKCQARLKNQRNQPGVLLLVLLFTFCIPMFRARKGRSSSLKHLISGNAW